MSPGVISCSLGRMAGCFSSAPEAERSGFVQAGAERAQVTPGGHVSTCPQLIDLFSEALSLGDPHPGLLGCIQLLDSQGSPPALSGGGCAVSRKAEAKCGDPEQPLDVAISSGVENVILETNRAAWGTRASSDGSRELCSEGPRFQGQPSAGLVSHLGPCHQRLLLASPFKDDPRLSKSAGLFFPGQCLQHTGSTSRWISSTRLRTNGFHRLSADRTHASVTSLSL
ncbi:hypothetical protein T02_8394 [Trichinella nativa]|uniref:Uncharacterized protein n=1 Tax=Trichinella nativa TaxID=6335 RepID=A0A0V1LIP1_9BILA|nr:hypothetical protein T02_8394 [Trichinella nativa]